MKVILLRPVEALGKPGDVVEVSSGYASNYLIPRMLADIATPELIDQLQARQKRQVKNAKNALLRAEQDARQLEGKVFTITGKASGEGRLYAAIAPAKISALLKAQEYMIEPKQIRAEHIKTLGEHSVIIVFHHALEARIIVSVRAEGEVV